MHERYFRLPEEVSTEALLQLLSSIPENWCWVDTSLAPPPHLIVQGSVADHTGYEMDRYFKVNLAMTSSDPEQEPELLALAVERKYPRFVHFKTVGDNKKLFEKGMNLLHGFISIGYRGSLSFYSGCVHNRMYDNPARCSMQFLPWNGLPSFGKEQGAQPPRVLVEWHEKHGGTEELVAPIIRTCQKIGLPEYLPTLNEVF